MFQFRTWKRIQQIVLSATVLLGLSACGTDALNLSGGFSKDYSHQQQEARAVGKQVLEEILGSEMPLPSGYAEALQATLTALNNHKLQLIVPERILISGNSEKEAMGAYASKGNLLFLPAYLFDLTLAGQSLFLKSTLVHELVHAAQDWLYQGQNVTHGELELKAYLIEHVYVQQVLQMRYEGDWNAITMRAQTLAEHWIQNHEHPSAEHELAYGEAEVALMQALQESYNIEKIDTTNNGFE